MSNFAFKKMIIIFRLSSIIFIIFFYLLFLDARMANILRFF